MLSLISVLGVVGVLGVCTISPMNANLKRVKFIPFCPMILPQVSAVRTRRSSSKTLFVRTHIAIYFVSLLICNLDQAIGGIIKIPWIVARGILSRVKSTTPGVIKQPRNVPQPLHTSERRE